MQAALSHTNVIHNSDHRPPSPSFARAAAKPATQPLPAYFIPTPDANGQADDYDSLLPPNLATWTEPRELIKFSEKVEECCYGRGGLNYEMDELDVTWLTEFNAKEEGSSADGAQARMSRSGKGQDKDEGNGIVRIADDIFEYIMGMFELWTEKNVPMLHTDLSLLPHLVVMEPIFKTLPPASFFPSFEQPKGLPSPRILTKMASRVYPHWKSRKEQRKGKSIIPQLNYDETNESDPYLCFRRRDLKVQRKTRVKDTTPVNRLEQVQEELSSATLLVNMILMREKQKQRQLQMDKELWEARWNTLEIKRNNPSMPMTTEEESLLFPHRATSNNQPPAKRQRIGDKDREQREREESARIAQMQLGQKGARSRAVSPIAEKVPPEQLAGILAERIEKEMKRKREQDRFAETPGVTYQPLPTTAPLKYFRCLPATDSRFGQTQQSLARSNLDHKSVLRDQEDGEAEDDRETVLRETVLSRPNHQMCFRLRRGRGGITRLDRKMPTVRHVTRNQGRFTMSDDPFRRLFPINPLATRDVLDEDSSSEEGRVMSTKEREAYEEQEGDRARILSERWRYDYDGGMVGVGMGVKDEDQVVIDDYEAR